MTEFLSLLGDIFDELFKLMSDSRIASVLGITVFQALVCFFVMWMLVYMLVFRANAAPGSLISVLPRSESPEVTVRERVQLHHGRDKKGKPVDRVSRSRTYTDRDGNSYTESWDS